MTPMKCYSRALRLVIPKDAISHMARRDRRVHVYLSHQKHVDTLLTDGINIGDRHLLAHPLSERPVNLGLYPVPAEVPDITLIQALQSLGRLQGSLHTFSVAPTDPDDKLIKGERRQARIIFPTIEDVASCPKSIEIFANERTYKIEISTEIKCFHCKGLGHVRSLCPQLHVAPVVASSDPLDLSTSPTDPLAPMDIVEHSVPGSVADPQVIQLAPLVPPSASSSSGNPENHLTPALSSVSPATSRIPSQHPASPSPTDDVPAEHHSSAYDECAMDTTPTPLPQTSISPLTSDAPVASLHPASHLPDAIATSSEEPLQTSLVVSPPPSSVETAPSLQPHTLVLDPTSLSLPRREPVSPRHATHSAISEHSSASSRLTHSAPSSSTIFDSLPAGDQIWFQPALRKSSSPPSLEDSPPSRGRALERAMLSSPRLRAQSSSGSPRSHLPFPISAAKLSEIFLDKALPTGPIPAKELARLYTFPMSKRLDQRVLLERLRDVLPAAVVQLEAFNKWLRKKFPRYSSWNKKFEGRLKYFRAIAADQSIQPTHDSDPTDSEPQL